MPVPGSDKTFTLVTQTRSGEEREIKRKSSKSSTTKLSVTKMTNVHQAVCVNLKSDLTYSLPGLNLPVGETSFEA